MADGKDHVRKTQIIRGVPFPKSERFLRRNIEDAMDLQPQEDDIIIASYPKTGTTWLQYIILQIIFKGENVPSIDEVPFLELHGVERLYSALNPRIYMHHIPYNMVKKNAKSKCFYIYRNPEDTVVSYYNFIQSIEDAFIDFESFFERFLTGTFEFGSYFHHVLSFYEHRNDSNLHMVSYERLHANAKEEILKIAAFIGKEHYQCLADNEAILEKVMENIRFEAMMSKFQLSKPVQQEITSLEIKQKMRVHLFRKGIVGDGKNVLSGAQQRRLKDAVAKEMKDPSIADEWLLG